MDGTPVRQMPIITLWQPWASWIALGWKTIETRTHPRFKCLSGQRIGIHAGVKWDDNATKIALPYLTAEQIERTYKFLRIGGAIIATAHVKDFRLVTVKDSPAALIDCDREHTLRWGLILDEIQVLDAIPMKGAQGIWYAK